MVQGEPWGLHGFFSTFRLACSNLHQENEEVWRCSSLSSICWDYVLNGECSDWCPVECVRCYHCDVMCFDWLLSWYCVCVGCLLFDSLQHMFNPNPLGILARNLPESSKILHCTFGNMPLSSKCTMHRTQVLVLSESQNVGSIPGSGTCVLEQDT